MYARNADYYFRAGELALWGIDLALRAAKTPRVRRVLDLPCGHGRITRHLRAAYPDAELLACDILREGVDFCVERFDATPVYSVEDPEQIPIPGEVDLIWSGSLFTHIGEDVFRAFLRRFSTALAPGGVAVFTTCGRQNAEKRLRTNTHPFGLNEQQIERMLADYDHTGFSYCDNLSRDWPKNFPSSFGTTVAAGSWVCKAIEEETDLLLMLCIEGGWGEYRNEWGQDLIACAKPIHWRDLESLRESNSDS